MASSFVPQALAAGAVAVLAEREPDLPPDVAFIETRDVRRALALSAAAFFPRQPETIAAVTGTSGKTSVAAFTRQIWAALGLKAASIGTIGVVSPQGETYGSLTTPDPIALHQTLDRLAGEGVTHLALEASSHGLEQRRLDGVRIAAGGFTNFSRDHLDYHPTMEAYLAAKLRLFDTLDRGGRHRGRRRRRLLRRPGGRRRHETRAEDDDRRRLMATTSNSSMAPSTASARSLRLPTKARPTQSSCRWSAPSRCRTRRLPPAWSSPPAAIRRACSRRLKNCKAPRAGSSLPAAKNGAPIFIDYAHKPDALQKALAALRPYAKGKLTVVFGAGGDRDKGKRPLMGRIATENADRVIVTDDNPRSEQPAAIRAEILAAASGAAEIGDRAEAIRLASPA